MADQSDYATRIYAVPLVWFMVGVGLAASLINQKQDMALLCLVVLLIVALAWGWSRSLRSGLSLQTITDRQRVFPGEPFGMELTVENAGFLPAWIQASPPFEEAMEVLDGGDGRSLNTALRWHEKAHFKWRLKATKRGVYRIGPSQVSTGDLLGFFPRAKASQPGRELIVFPRLVTVGPLALSKRDFFGSPAPGSPVDDPVYMLGTRDYQPGRPARFIHWRASARHQRWQEKVFEPSAQSKVMLVLAASGFVDEQDRDGFERAIEVLASLAVAYHRQGLQVRLASDALSTDSKLRDETSSSAEMPLVGMLERLARLRFLAGKPLLTSLVKEPNRLRRADVIFFSHSFDRSAAEAEAYFRHQSIPATFIVKQTDPDGSTAAQERLYLLSDLSPEAGA
jgi:uncharacterized protein (DUF58 family)